jgi:YcxB-like protein
MVIHFAYDKTQVLQALRYHFITRPEIKVMLIVVNLFTILSAVLLYIHKIRPLPFLVFSALWFLMLISIWKLLPGSVYRKSATFLDRFSMSFLQSEVVLQTTRGSHTWQWPDFSSFTESPYFFHLYFNSRAFFLVPKDAFRSIPELQEIRALLREKIGK